MSRIAVTDNLSIDEDEIAMSFIRSGGPGGQNVNKVATAVQLRFDIAGSPSLPEAVKRRLVGLGGRRVSKEGVLVLTASGERTQEANRRDAMARLVELIEQATHVRKRRVPTRPGKGAVQRRLDRKSQRSGIKQLRGRPEAGE